MYTPNEIEAFSMIFDEQMKALEMQVMQDIIRRIKINSEITRSADWQLYRLHELDESKRILKKAIKDAFGFDGKEINHLYKDIIRKGYARDETLYKTKGKPFIPFDENEALQQYISAIAHQTAETMMNISQSLGFAVKSGDTRIFKPIAKYYHTTLDNAINGIATGVFDYDTVLKRTVSEMTNSGLRTVDYETGWSNRVEVAARRAVMTGLTQVTAKINESNAEQLETDMFEITWHSGARPSHQVWQGRWYSKAELESVCGLGSVTGLCGANCYHSYYPVIPGVSVPTYTEEELDEMNRQENIPIDFNGKQYTKYEALQRQRQLETRMRAERQKIKLLQEGGADETDIMLARAKYRGTSQEYTSFSKAMDLPQQRQRVTVDGLGNIGVGKYTKPVEKANKSGIMKSEWDNNLTPRGQLPHIEEDDLYSFVANELRISEDVATDYVESIFSFTDEYYSNVRAYQRKEFVEDIDRIENLANNIESYIKSAPRWNGGATYRGISVSDEEMSKYTKGYIFDMGGTSSWSDQLDIAQDFADRNVTFERPNSIVYYCETQTKGTGIRHISVYEYESEVLSSKESKYMIDRIEGEYGQYRVYLKEV